MGVRIKDLLAQGKHVRVFMLGQFCSPKLVEMIGLHGGWDGVWFDIEHVGLTLPQIEECARAARATGLDSFVRLAATDYATVMQPLEAGAGGVMAAQVRNAEQVKDIVTWAKFHPQGLRGVNGSGVDGRYGMLPAAEYFRQANAETLVLIQIEHIDAVNDVDRIAAVPGVDVLFIGPADLSQSMGLPGEWEHPRVWDAYRRVADAAQRNGIHWAILPLNPSYAQRCTEMGCRMLSVGLDVWAFAKGLKAFQADYGGYSA
jgi:2-keto-3-deoxy-L-rhamnonate aldolase RhmA